MNRRGRMSWGMAGWGLAVLAGLALVGCDDPAPRQAEAPARSSATAPTAQPQGRPAAALLVAEDRLRSVLRAEAALTLRAVQAYRQAMPDTLAICGQVNPSGRSDEPFLPWVAVVTFAGLTPTRTEFYIAASTLEATRVYFEMVDRCFDGGGPASPRQVVRPLPPAPTGLPRSEADPAPRGLAPIMPAPNLAPPNLAPPNLSMPAAAPLPAAPALPAAASLPAPAALRPAVPAAPASTVQGVVTTTTRHPVNMRAHPSGEAAVVRVVPRAASLQVFGEAPGGWLQVGQDGEALGWLHNSLIER